jgi:hypothetical protein
MAGAIPEFISVLRDIRDTKYPQIKSWFDSVFSMNSNVENIEQNVELIQADITNKNLEIKNISVVNPITSVPNNPNGSAGLASVVYNGATNQFTFGIPVGERGQSMRIDYTVNLITDLYTLTVNKGDIVFVAENSSNYVKLDTGVNAGASDWSDPILITPATDFLQLTDTPVSYAGQSGKVPVVSTAENSLVFKTGAEMGIIGYNYVKNPLFDNLTLNMPVITNVAFGANARGYGTFTTFTGTPTLASDHVRITNGVTISNTSVFTSGKSAVGIRFQLETEVVVDSTILNVGNMRLFIDGNSKFAVTDGDTTNELETGMTPNITDLYELYATDQDLIVLNRTTGVMASHPMVLTIEPQTSGSVIIGGNGMGMKIYAVSVQDKSDYTQVNGVYESFAEDWFKQTTGGEMGILPDIEGYSKGMRFLSGGLATESKVKMTVGDGGQFSGKVVTLSFTAFSVGVGANSIGINFITDRGSQISTSRLITQSIGNTVLDNGIEKNYVVTFTVDEILDGTFLDADASDYFEFTLPVSANYWISVSKPKFEISNTQSDFTPQGAREPIPYTKEEVDAEVLALENDINLLSSEVSLKAPSDSPTLTGETTVVEFTETTFTITGTTPEIDIANGTIQKWILSGNSTPTSNLKVGQSLTLKVRKDVAYTLTWTSISPIWVGGVEPTVVSTGYTVIVLWRDQDGIYGTKVGNVA